MEYVNCQEEGCNGLHIPDNQEISWGQKPEENLMVGGDTQPNAYRLEAVYGHSLILNPSLSLA